MKATYILLSLYNAPILSLDQVCSATGYEKQTIYNERVKGVFPIPLRKQGNSLIADTRDVGDWLDQQRELSRFGTA
jgi:predicted DNA-binding transcriptional regulator AlpA